tara:strand:- start:1733 stop:2158 length:426 start_codon:yes stop_codon:yes gene_type:complete
MTNNLYYKKYLKYKKKYLNLLKGSGPKEVEQNQSFNFGALSVALDEIASEPDEVKSLCQESIFKDSIPISVAYHYNQPVGENDSRDSLQSHKSSITESMIVETTPKEKSFLKEDRIIYPRINILSKRTDSNSSRKSNTINF